MLVDQNLIDDVINIEIEFSLIPFVFLIFATGAVFTYLYNGIYAWGRFNNLYRLLFWAYSRHGLYGC